MPWFSLGFPCAATLGLPDSSLVPVGLRPALLRRVSIVVVVVLENSKPGLSPMTKAIAGCSIRSLVMSSSHQGAIWHLGGLFDQASPWAVAMITLGVCGGAPQPQVRRLDLWMGSEGSEASASPTRRQCEACTAWSAQTEGQQSGSYTEGCCEPFPFSCETQQRIGMPGENPLLSHWGDGVHCAAYVPVHIPGDKWSSPALPRRERWPSPRSCCPGCRVYVRRGIPAGW